MFYPNILIYRYIQAIFVIHLNNPVGGRNVHINHVCPFDLQTVWKKRWHKKLVVTGVYQRLNNDDEDDDDDDVACRDQG